MEEEINSVFVPQQWTCNKRLFSCCSNQPTNCCQLLSIISEVILLVKQSYWTSGKHILTKKKRICMLELVKHSCILIDFDSGADIESAWRLLNDNNPIKILIH